MYMKTLYLVRHAKAIERSKIKSDFDRDLTEKGQKTSILVGKHLSSLNILPDLVISSPAKRAYNTAIIICKELNYPEKNIILNRNIYEAAALELFRLIKETSNAYNSVMLVGHNPSFIELVNYICQAPNVDKFPKCGVANIQFTLQDWNDIKPSSGNLIFLISPKSILNHEKTNIVN